MVEFNRSSLKEMSDARYCYGKEGGQGFVAKSECTCTDECPCQGKVDSKRFLESFKREEVDGSIKERVGIIAKIKPDFSDSKWWRDNIVE